MKTEQKTINKNQVQSNSNKVSKIKCFGKAIKVTWGQFSTRTSIHGVQYIGDQRGTFFTRFLWIGVTILSFVASNILVSMMIVRYQSNPTRVNIETNFAPLPQISYPAITVCPSNYVTMKKVVNFLNSLKFPENVSMDEVLPTFDQVVGFFQPTLYDPYELDLIQEILALNRYDIPAVMTDLRSSCKELLFRCRLEGKIQDCARLFKKSMTYNGYCCSFNLADFRNANFKPISPTVFGVGKGLSFIVKPDTDSMLVSKIYSEGIQLLIDESTAYPGGTGFETVLPFQTESLVSVKISATYCEKQVRALPIDDRGCVFPEEFNLKHFRVPYKEANCDIECRTAKAYELCDCIPYYFPNFENLPVCNFTKIECLVENFYVLHKFYANGSLTLQCDCPDNCDTTNYNVNADVFPLQRNNFTIDPFYKGINESHMIVHVYMASQFYQKLRRDLLTNIIGLVSNFGGVYSLFLGISVIGFVEVIYFPTIRLYENYKTIIKNENRRPVIKIEGVEARFSSDGRKKSERDVIQTQNI